MPPSTRWFTPMVSDFSPIGSKEKLWQWIGVLWNVQNNCQTARAIDVTDIKKLAHSLAQKLHICLFCVIQPAVGKLKELSDVVLYARARCICSIFFFTDGGTETHIWRMIPRTGHARWLRIFFFFLFQADSCDLCDWGNASDRPVSLSRSMMVPPFGIVWHQEIFI